MALFAGKRMARSLKDAHSTVIKTRYRITWLSGCWDTLITTSTPIKSTQPSKSLRKCQSIKVDSMTLPIWSGSLKSGTTRWTLLWTKWEKVKRCQKVTSRRWNWYRTSWHGWWSYRFGFQSIKCSWHHTSEQVVLIFTATLLSFLQ